VSEASQKLLIIGTQVEENPDMVTLLFALGSSALSIGKDVTVILQSTSLDLAMKEYAYHIHASGFLLSGGTRTWN
jgi:predicted peroxiredoxin